MSFERAVLLPCEQSSEADWSRSSYRTLDSSECLGRNTPAILIDAVQKPCRISPPSVAVQPVGPRPELFLVASLVRNDLTSGQCSR